MDSLMRRLFGRPIPGMGDWAESERYRGRRLTFPMQPRNTSSNLAYLLVGLTLGTWLWTAEAVVFGLCMAALGLGSALYHGWPTPGTRKLDHVGMYATFTAMLFAALGAEAVVMAMAAAGAAIVGSRLPLRLEWGLGATLGGVLWILSDPGLAPMGVLSLAVFVGSYGCWQLDRNREWTGHWGHFVWHVGTAAAIGLMWLAVP